MARQAQLRIISSRRATPEILPPEERLAYQRELLHGFLRSRSVTLRPSSVRNGLAALRANFLPWLESRELYVWEVTPDDLDDFAAVLKNSVKTRTHQGYFVQVQQFYEWIVARRGTEIRQRFGIEMVNPVDRFNRTRRLGEDERLVPIPREEVIDYFLAFARATIDAAPSDIKWLQACRNYALWMVFNWSGLRRGETATLTPEDVDLASGCLRVRQGKGGKGRIVQIQPPLAPVLRWYMQDVRPQLRGGAKAPYLFLNARLAAMHPDGIRNLLHREQVAAGIAGEEQFTCHGFRRAYATRLYKALRAESFRDPLVYVQQQLGHEYLSTTQRYCQLDDDYRYFLVQQAAEALIEHYGPTGRNGAHE
ncbi:MAG: tyrosine-type recombinase/integrase [Dehalococcoidia bacterium]|nr:tyrosine-type recombinase/integrase [Dehalococcoidia bacterium]